MRAELTRLRTLKTCVIGQLSLFSAVLDREVLRVGTLELPWRDNKKGESCIPCGRYVCRRVCSPKFGDTFEICGVPDRQGILFHTGNTAKDTKGCVLIGELIDLKSESLVNSKKAFENFMNELESYNDFILEVR